MNSGAIKRVLWKFDQEKLKKIYALIFTLELLIFLYLYLANRNPIDWVDNYVGPVGPPGYLFSIYGEDDDIFRKPMAVTVSPKTDRIYVTDSDNFRVQVFDYDGNRLFVFGKNGTGKGEFSFPYGIAVSPQEQVYVADLSNGKISVFNEKGSFLQYFGQEGDFKRPAGLFLDENYLYVADVALNKILVFNLDGTKVKEIGEEGKRLGEFRSPNSVFVSGALIYVVDTGNNRVQIFNKLGNFTGLLNGGNVKFINPRGIGVDGRGTVYVVNNLTHQIFGFDSKGNKLFDFGSMGQGDGQLLLPNGLFIDGQGRIYITDTANQRVNVFQN